MFKDMFKIGGKVLGTVAGVPLGVLMVTLGCSEAAIREAVDAGCETIEEIKEFVNK